MLLIVDEIERLTRQFSPDNGRLANIKLTNDIIDKMEGHFDKIKTKLKSSELSMYNFSIAEIQNIIPAKLDRDAALMLTEQSGHSVFRPLILHIRTINSLFRTIHYRTNL